MSDKKSFENLLKKVQVAVRRLGSSKTVVTTLTLAAALNSGEAKAKAAVEQKRETERSIDLGATEKFVGMGEATADYADFVIETEDEYDVARKMGLKAVPDNKGGGKIVSVGSKGRMTVDAQYAHDLKMQYIRKQREAFYRSEAGKVNIREKKLSEVRNQDGGVRLGGYSFSAKNININKLVKDGKNPADAEIVRKVNRAIERTVFHERMHEASDRNNVYGPGISPEQRAIVNMNDEAAALASELYLCICYYQQKIKSGVPVEKALEVFDQGDIHFVFFKEAVAEGMNPISEEGRRLMVQGSCRMWCEQFAKGYSEQLIRVGMYGLNEQDIGGIVVGDRDELNRRIRSIWAKVGNNQGVSELKLPRLIGLEKYLEMDQMNRLPTHVVRSVRAALDKRVEEKTGLSRQEINAVCACLNPIGSDADRQKELTGYLQSLDINEMIRQEKNANKSAEEIRYMPRPWGREGTRW